MRISRLEYGVSLGNLRILYNTCLSQLGRMVLKCEPTVRRVHMLKGPQNLSRDRIFGYFGGI